MHIERTIRLFEHHGIIADLADLVPIDPPRAPLFVWYRIKKRATIVGPYHIVGNILDRRTYQFAGTQIADVEVKHLTAGEIDRIGQQRAIRAWLKAPQLKKRV
jgi:hypothetical protein